MWKGLGLFGLVCIAGLIAAQFLGPERHREPIDPSQTIEVRTQMPRQVSSIVHRACRDCHTDTTDWQWYGNIAPGSWLQTADVYVAREHMNLSQWGKYTAAQQADRLKGMCEMVTKGVMPLWYYRILHYPSAWLSNADVNTICQWTKAERQKLGVTVKPAETEDHEHEH